MWGKCGKKQLKFYKVMAKPTLLYVREASIRRKKKAGVKQQKWIF
jgi:hypothetical protein